MGDTYTNIRIYTSEKERTGGKTIAQAVVHFLRGLRIGARCAVFRGEEGLYENGEISTAAITDQSYNLPVLIDVLVPAEHAQDLVGRLRLLAPSALIGMGSATFEKAGK